MAQTKATSPQPYSSPSQPESEPPKQEASRPGLPLPVPPPTAKPLEPSKLVGLTEEEIKQLIGAPAAVSQQPPAVVWSYSSAGCGLQLFFYLDMTSQLYKTLTYELKPKKPGELRGSACVASLRAPSPAGSAGHE